MANRLSVPALLLLPLLVLLPSRPCAASPREGPTWEGGLHLLVSTDPNSAPSPLIGGLGVSLPLSRPGRWRLETGLQLFGTWYRYSGGRAIPAEPEQREYLLLALLGDLRLGPEWRLNERFSIGGAGGLAALLRLPVPAAGSTTPAEADFSPTVGYLYGRARFLLPETVLFTRWKASERVELRTSLRICYPLFHLWDGEGLPFTDQMIVSGLIGLRYTPPAR